MGFKAKILAGVAIGAVTAYKALGTKLGVGTLQDRRTKIISKKQFSKVGKTLR